MSGIFDGCFTLLSSFFNKTAPVEPSARLKEMKFIVFDTETTGFYPSAGDELISIGAVTIDQGKIDNKAIFHEWINPNRSIPQEIIDLTQADPKQIFHSSPAHEVISRYLEFICGEVLVSHCSDFDLNFINRKLKKEKRPKIKNPVIDTLSVSYHLHPLEKSHGLDALLAFYDIPILNRHNALGDAFMTAELFLNLLDELERKEVKTWHGLSHFLRSMQLLHRASF